MKKEIDALLKDFTAGDDSATAQITFPPEFSGFQGHFPDRPVLPGVCQVNTALAVAERLHGSRLRLLEVKDARFVSVVVPEQMLEVMCRLNDGLATVSLSSGDEPVAKFKLKVEDA